MNMFYELLKSLSNSFTLSWIYCETMSQFSGLLLFLVNAERICCVCMLRSLAWVNCVILLGRPTDSTVYNV